MLHAASKWFGANDVFDPGTGVPDERSDRVYRVDKDGRETTVRERGQEVLAEARSWYDKRQGYRTRRGVSVDLYMGNQWENIIAAEDGRLLKEKDYLADKGRLAVTMNICAPVINNLQGQFRQNKAERQVYAVTRGDEEGVEMLNMARRSFRRKSDSTAREADGFFEWTLSGAAMFRSSYELDPATGRYEVQDAAVHATRGFYNMDVLERQLDGLKLVGQLHDVTVEEIITNFAFSPEDEDRIRGYYPDKSPASQNLGSWYSGSGFYDQVAAGDFHSPADASLARVVEAWVTEYEWTPMAFDPLSDPDVYLQALALLAPIGVNVEDFVLLPQGYGPLPSGEDQESVQRRNLGREQFNIPPIEIRAEKFIPSWYCYYLSPDGDVIYQKRTPYWHGEHPYTLGNAFWVDGQTRGLIDTIEDPQRWLNRVLMSIDHQMITGPKGTMLYDLDILDGSGLTQSDVDEAIVRGDATLGIRPQGGRLTDMYEQIKSQSLSAGVFEMVPVLMQFVERLSGVNDASQGRGVKSGTSGVLNQQMIQQGALSVFIYTDTYLELLQQKDRKEIRLIQQALQSPQSFYDQSTGKSVSYEPFRARALEVEIALGSASDTATLRLAQEQMLRADMEAGAISPLIYFDHSARPDARKLAEAIRLEQQAQQLTEAQQFLAADELGLLEPETEEDNG